MFRVEIERSDGKTFFRGGSKPEEWFHREDADWQAEQLWLRFNGSGQYASFRVIEQDGTVYSEWEM